MKHQYHLVRVMHPDEMENIELRQRELEVQKNTTRHHPVLWVLGTLFVVIVVLAAVWMSSISTSLAHANQIATSNSKAIGQVSNQLSGIQATLRAMEAEIQRFFLALMNNFHHQ